MFVFAAPAIRPEDDGDCPLRIGRNRCFAGGDAEERRSSGKGD
jgi:hypothetical protein